jgi:hypothetical protein
MIQDLVQDIHSTLKNYSVGLKQQNYLLEKAWTLVDGNLNVHRLIFKKKGVLRAFKNGNLEDNCTWDYEPSINSLIIKIGNDAVVLNEIFLDGKVLILRQDNTNEFWIFIDSSLLQGNNLEDYLREIISKTQGPGDEKPFIFPFMEVLVFILIIGFILLLLESIKVIL